MVFKGSRGRGDKYLGRPVVYHVESYYGQEWSKEPTGVVAIMVELDHRDDRSKVKIGDARHILIKPQRNSSGGSSAPQDPKFIAAKEKAKAQQHEFYLKSMRESLVPAVEDLDVEDTLRVVFATQVKKWDAVNLAKKLKLEFKTGRGENDAAWRAVAEWAKSATWQQLREILVKGPVENETGKHHYFTWQTDMFAAKAVAVMVGVDYDVIKKEALKEHPLPTKPKPDKPKDEASSKTKGKGASRPKGKGKGKTPTG